MVNRPEGFESKQSARSKFFLLKVMTKKLFFLKPNQEKASLSLAAAPESSGTEVLGVRVKKTGGSKKSELKSKSLLELLGMLDDVGKQKAADALKSVDPQQSLGISHLGLDGYLRKAFELLEKGFLHMEGSGITYTERRRLNELRGKQATGEGLTAGERSELEDLVEKEEEDELETTSEYLGVENAALNAVLVSDVVKDKIDALKSSFPQLAIAIGSSVKTLKDVRQALDYRNIEYEKTRNRMSDRAYESTEYSKNIPSRPDDYAQYVENEAVGPLAKIISEDSGKVITREQIENAPNILRYLGKNKKRQKEAWMVVPPHITDPLDYDVIKHGGKIYVAEVKGKSRGSFNLIGEPKRKAFNEIIQKISKTNRGTEVVPIILWPNEPPQRMSKSGKYYSHIPSYSYVVDPNWNSKEVLDFTNPNEKTYNFVNAKTIENPKHKASSDAVEQRTKKEDVAARVIQKTVRRAVVSEPESEAKEEPGLFPFDALERLDDRNRISLFSDFRKFTEGRAMLPNSIRLKLKTFYEKDTSVLDKDIENGLEDYILYWIKAHRV
jgi:ribosomal protein L10